MLANGIVEFLKNVKVISRPHV